jgi:hypothetical protein
MCSRRVLVRGLSCYCPGVDRAHRLSSESACIVAVMLSEASHAVVLVLSEPTISC